MQLFYKHSYFLMNQCSKSGQKTSQFPCHENSHVDLEGDFPALFFQCYSLFTLSCIFFANSSKTANTSYSSYTSYSALSPRKVGITRIQIVLEKNKIILALRIALSVNGMIQNGTGDIRASLRSPDKAQWHRAGRTSRWGTKGMAKSSR